MQRLSTPTHIFTLDIDTSLIKTLRIVYKQGEIVRLVKYGTDAKIEGNTVTLKLTQEETQKFSAADVYIQLDILTTGGDALHSAIIKRSVSDVLLDEVLK
jgi:hypothetical protein